MSAATDRVVVLPDGTPAQVIPCAPRARPGRYNGRCGACKGARSALVSDVVYTRIVLPRIGGFGVRHATIGAADGRWSEIDDVNRIALACPCGGVAAARRVQGRVNSAIKCNAKCQGATGHECECVCGGKNHGAAHGAA